METSLDPPSAQDEGTPGPAIALSPAPATLASSVASTPAKSPGSVSEGAQGSTPGQAALTPAGSYATDSSANGITSLTSPYSDPADRITDGRIVEGSMITSANAPGEGCNAGPRIFWVRRTQDGKEPPKSCLEGFTGVDISSEIPESELTTVPLETKEQRLDWRDFLCEMVASNNALTLFNSYDVGADPPKYPRPPPSVPQVEAMAHVHRLAGHMPPRCVAPNGTGWNLPQNGASSPGPRLKSTFAKSLDPAGGDCEDEPPSSSAGC